MRLLGLYKQTQLELEKLDLTDKRNVAEIAADPRFKSLIKLLSNQKASFLKQSVFGRLEDEERNIYKGGAMALTAVFSAIEAEILKGKAEAADDDMKKMGMDIAGW